MYDAGHGEIVFEAARGIIRRDQAERNNPRFTYLYEAFAKFESTDSREVIEVEAS